MLTLSFASSVSTLSRISSFAFLPVPLSMTALRMSVTSAETLSEGLLGLRIVFPDGIALPVHDLCNNRRHAGGELVPKGYTFPVMMVS